MGHIIKDWTKVDPRNPRHQALVRAAINHYFHAPMKAKVKEFTTKGDTPRNDMYEATFNQVDPFDFGWQQAFAYLDYRNTKKDYFPIRDVSSGLSFRKVTAGDKVEVYKFSGAKAVVNIDLWGGALGWSKEWFDDEDWTSIEQMTTEFRNKFYRDQAQAHYDLLSAAAADSDVTWKGTAGESNAARDAATINYCIADMIAALDAKGYVVTPVSPFVLFAPIQLRARIIQALRNLQQWSVMGGASTGDGGQVEYNIQPVFTTMLKNHALSAANTTNYEIVLPGRKIMGANRMDLTILNDTDILAYADTMAGWARFGAAVGDTAQVRRCAIS